MNKLNTSLPELLNMLKIIESNFKSEKASVLLVDKISKKKIRHKGSNKKKKVNPKASISKKKMLKSISTKGTCFHYRKDGHWKRDCKHYLASLKKPKEANSLYMIQTNLSLSTSTSDF